MQKQYELDNLESHFQLQTFEVSKELGTSVNTEDFKMLSAHKKFRKGYDEANAVLHLICEIDGWICLP